LHPTRLLPSTDARGLKLAGDGEENDVFGVDTEVATKVEGTINGDVVVGAI
jgi:hypothetical protein